AHYVWEQNKLKKNKAINLKGIAIGNGITNPALQNPHYIDMVDNQYNITMVNATQLAQMKLDAVTCGELMKPCSKANVSACIEGSEFCSEKLLQPLIAAKRNPYDLRMFCDKEDATQCYDMNYVSKYLDAPDVREYLGVPSDHVDKWQECNMQVNMDFYKTGDPGMDFSPYVADLLNDDLRVLIYAGDADMMCNWHGNQAWTKALEWDGKADFNAVEEHAYITASGVDAGVVRSHDTRFTFLRLFNSGHMVPQDQPEVALDMLNKFLKNEKL
ncbi:Serine protease family s10, partial [Globisporangium polare]